jgi:TonB-linked SusC/RagA family outer membrane protein
MNTTFTRSFSKRQWVPDMRILIVLGALILGTGAAGFAQIRTVTGKVTSSENGEMLPGVNVLIKGTTVGTVTDADGNYSLALEGTEGTLVFSFIGYLTQEVSNDGRSTIDLTMMPDVQTLGEVVVVGYGTQKKASVTAAISTLKGTEIASTPTTNLSNSLGGRISGVIVRQTTGDPGRDGSSIYIRGISSTGGTQPLIIVDGIPRDFSQLDPNTIESLTILKDAAAVAPYGVAGANGVILVTTKVGKKGEPSLRYSGYVGFQNPTVLPEFVNGFQYATLKNVAAVNEGLPLPYSDYALQKLKDGSDPDAWPDPNVWDMVTKNAVLTTHNIELSGGTEKVKYYSSLGYQSQEAMWPSTKNKRYNLAINLDAQVTNLTKVAFSINGRVQNATYPSIAPGRIWELLQYVNTRRGPLFFSNGKPGDKIPATILNSGYQKINTLAVYSQLSIEQELPFIPGLKAKGTIAYDPTVIMDKLWRIPTHITSIKDTTKHPYEFIDAIYDQKQSSLNQSFNQTSQITYQASLNYAKSFGNSNVTALALFEAKANNGQTMDASRRNYSLNVDELSMGSSSQADMTTGGLSSNARQVGLLYRVTYEYADKYLLEASGRYDGSYYFSPDNRFGFFPAFSLGWRLSEEDFIKNINWIDNLKLRGSYGEVGALAGSPFQYLSTYNVYGPAYVIDGQAAQAIRERNESNPAITWERARKKDIGLEASFWKGLLNVEVDYFYEKRSNMLVNPDVVVPAEYGIGLSQVNGGVMKNSGFDFSVGSVYSFSKDLQVSLGGNFTYAKNTLLKVFETPVTYDNPNRRKTGKPLNTQFGFHALGFFQLDDFNADGTLKEGIAVQPWGKVRPGDLRYEDINADGVINNDDLTSIGNPETPMIIYGITPNIRYKGFSLDLLFQGAAKSDRYLDRHMTSPFYNSMNAYVDNFNYWTPENPNAKHPRVTNAPTTNNSQASSWWMFSSDYVRLKSATLAYTLSSKIAEKIRMQNVRVYVSGQNLVTWTKLINYDPEGSGAYGNLYPQQKIVSVGLDVTF